MSTEILSKVFLPISLAVIMLGMGMTLVPGDFTRILKYPKAVVIGLTNQLILLPLIGFALVTLFDFDFNMAIGIMILASCPGGPTSNLITQVCNGNIALSVTLTALASFISILTIPVILSYSFSYFGNESGISIELPIIDMILQIMVITVIPISIGMLIRNFRTPFAIKMEKPMRIASTILFVLVFIAVIAANSNLLGKVIEKVGLVTLLLNVATMTLGFVSSKMFRLDFKSAISITIESGIQNGTLAFVIATTILSNFEMGIPTGAYSIWMFITGGMLMWKLSKK
jgi:BASS family bile acid:Na+ symporter